MSQSLWKMLRASVASFLDRDAPRSPSRLGSPEPAPSRLQQAMKNAEREIHTVNPWSGSARVPCFDNSRTVPKNFNREKLGMVFNGHMAGSLGMINSARHQARISAAKTLEEMGYCWRGGELWTPPLRSPAEFGKRETPPDWKHVEVNRLSPSWLLWGALANERERVEILDSKRLDLEQRLQLAETQANERVSTIEDTARLLREITAWQDRAAAETNRANILGDAIKYTIIKDNEGVFDGMLFLADWNEGEESAMRELEAYRTGKQHGTTTHSVVHGETGTGSVEMPDVPIGLGRGRPGPAEVQPEAGKERPHPISADMAAVVEAMDRGEMNLAWDLYSEVGAKLRAGAIRLEAETRRMAQASQNAVSASTLERVGGKGVNSPPTSTAPYHRR